jgi:hypothetical protein
MPRSSSRIAVVNTTRRYLVTKTEYACISYPYSCRTLSSADRCAASPAAVGSCSTNGDGAKDLLLWNASTLENTIWLMNFDNGAYYQVGPTLQPSLSPGWQVVPD